MRKGVIIGLVLGTGIMLVSASYAHYQNENPEESR